MNMGSWVGVEVAFGAAPMALKGEAFWIAIGVGIGVATGSATKSKKSDDESYHCPSWIGRPFGEGAPCPRPR